MLRCCYRTRRRQIIVILLCILIYFIGFNSISLKLLQGSGPNLDADHMDIANNDAGENNAPPREQSRMLLRQPFGVLQVFFAQCHRILMSRFKLPICFHQPKLALTY